MFIRNSAVNVIITIKVTVSEFGYGYGCEGGRGQWQGHEHGSRGLGTCTPLEGAVDNQQREPPQNES